LINDRSLSTGEFNKIDWNMTEMCTKHVYNRGKAKHIDSILKYLPIITKPAKYCATVVLIDHYKFIDGIHKHLQDRVTSFKKQGIFINK
jgi:hypothetical protein